MKEQESRKQTYEQLAAFRYKIRKFIRFSENAARNLGITPQSHQLMLMIMGFPDRDYATPTELAERLQMTHNACVGLITRSEQQGLVYKTTNPNDARSIYVKLTEKGMSILDSLSDIHVKELDNIGFDILLKGE